MPEIFRRNLSYKLISLLVAIILWGYVTNEQNPITQHTYDIPLQTKGLKSSYAILDMPKNIKVTVQTSKLSFSSLSPGNIQAFVDLSRAINIGEAYYPIEIKQDSNVRIISSKPESVKVILDYVAEKTFNIGLKTTSKINNQYIIKSSQLKPEQVTITGPQSMIGKIDSVVVSPDIGNAKGKQKYNLPIKILDSKGNLLPMDKLKLDKRNVLLSIEVDKNVVELEKPVKPQIVGQVEEGFYIDTIKIEPKEVLVSGDLTNLNLIKHVDTDKISINGKDQDFVTYVNLRVPNNCTIKGTKRVKIIFRIKPISIQKSLQKKVVIKELPPGLTATLDIDEVSLLVSGPENKLKDLDPYVYVDLKGFTVGEYNVKVKVVLPKGVIVNSLSPQFIKVTLQPQ